MAPYKFCMYLGLAYRFTPLDDDVHRVGVGVPGQRVVLGLRHPDELQGVRLDRRVVLVFDARCLDCAS